MRRPAQHYRNICFDRSRRFSLRSMMVGEQADKQTARHVRPDNNARRTHSARKSSVAPAAASTSLPAEALRRWIPAYFTRLGAPGSPCSAALLPRPCATEDRLDETRSGACGRHSRPRHPGAWARAIVPNTTQVSGQARRLPVLHFADKLIGLVNARLIRASSMVDQRSKTRPRSQVA